jgi:hypothetical protein
MGTRGEHAITHGSVGSPAPIEKAGDPKRMQPKPSVPGKLETHPKPSSTPRTAEQEASFAYNTLCVLLRVLFGSSARVCEIMSKDPLDSSTVLRAGVSLGCFMLPVGTS